MEDIINSIDILGHLCMIWGNISVVCNRCSAQDNTEPCVCVPRSRGSSSRAPFSSQDVSCASALLSIRHQSPLSINFLRALLICQWTLGQKYSQWHDSVKKVKTFARIYVVWIFRLLSIFVKMIDCNQSEIMWCVIFVDLPQMKFSIDQI